MAAVRRATKGGSSSSAARRLGASTRHHRAWPPSRHVLIAGCRRGMFEAPPSGEHRRALGGGVLSSRPEAACRALASRAPPHIRDRPATRTLSAPLESVAWSRSTPRSASCSIGGRRRRRRRLSELTGARGPARTTSAALDLGLQADAGRAARPSRRWTLPGPAGVADRRACTARDRGRLQTGAVPARRRLRDRPRRATTRRLRRAGAGQRLPVRGAPSAGWRREHPLPGGASRTRCAGARLAGGGGRRPWARLDGAGRGWRATARVGRPGRGRSRTPRTRACRCRAPSFQVLIYPMLDATAGPPSYDGVRRSGFGFSTREVAAGTSTSTCRRAPTGASPRVSPLFEARRPRGCRRRWSRRRNAIPLRDEGETPRGTRSARGRGTMAELRRYPGMIHGFFQMTALEGSRRLHRETASGCASTPADSVHGGARGRLCSAHGGVSPRATGRAAA